MMRFLIISRLLSVPLVSDAAFITDRLHIGNRRLGLSGLAMCAEIFATHIENKIRAEQSLPLRTYYSVEEGIYKGRIINKKNGTSLFYDSKEKTNYKKLKKEQIPFKYGAK